MRQVLAAAILLAFSGPAWAQGAAAPASTATPPAAPAAAGSTTPAPDSADDDGATDLDVLMAPVALLPDPLLAAVLQASVVPVDVIAATKFLDAYETDKTVQPDPQWDPAVIGLLGFPTMLRAMAANMDWVEEAGDAVLDDLPAVQDSIQQDRAEFYAAGVLNSDDKQNVIVEKDIIRIEPVDPKVIYLPVYDAAALAEAIRTGDASIAAQPATPPADQAKTNPLAGASQGGAEASDAAARAEAAAKAAQDAATASQQAAGQAQASAQQSAGSAADAAQAGSVPPAQTGAVPPAQDTAAYSPVPSSYAPVSPAYATPVTYAAPVTYADSSGSSSTWSTVGTLAGGALIGGILGYALGDDDDDDHDGWWDDDDDIHIDEDDLDDFLDDARRNREDARDEWQGFAEDAREDRQRAASDRQQERQDAAADRRDDLASRREDRRGDVQAAREDRQAGRGDRQANRQTGRDDRLASRQGERGDRQSQRSELIKQRNTDAQARLDQRAQKSRQPLASREVKKSPSPVGGGAHAKRSRDSVPQLNLAKDSSAAKARPAAHKQVARPGSAAAKPSSAIGGLQRGQTVKAEQARGVKSRQQVTQRPAAQRQASRPAASSRQVSRPAAPKREAHSRPAQRGAIGGGGKNKAAAHGSRGKRSRGR